MSNSVDRCIWPEEGLGDIIGLSGLDVGFFGFKVTSIKALHGTVQLSVGCVIPCRSNRIQISTNLTAWATISTNIAVTNNFNFTNTPAANVKESFYRAGQLP